MMFPFLSRLYMFIYLVLVYDLLHLGATVAQG